MAAKISLFHVPSNAKCAISSAVRLNVRAMANLVPNTRRESGSASPLSPLLVVVLRVSAFLTQSVNGCALSAEFASG